MLSKRHFVAAQSEYSYLETGDKIVLEKDGRTYVLKPERWVLEVTDKMGNKTHHYFEDRKSGKSYLKESC